MEYNYLEAVSEDVTEYIRGEFTPEEIREKLTDRDEWEQELNDTLWCCDAVTGNASGSYTFSTWQAEEYLAHNWDLLADAIDEFGGDTNILRAGAEACDVTIRCYLLGQAIAEAIDEIETEAENND